MKLGLVAKQRGTWPVRWLCEALGVSRSGFHGWLTRPRSDRALADAVLTARVRASFVGSSRTYGTRRVRPKAGFTGPPDSTCSLAVLSAGR
jgi:putative transposase